MLDSLLSKLSYLLVGNVLLLAIHSECFFKTETVWIKFQYDSFNEILVWYYYTDLCTYRGNQNTWTNWGPDQHRKSLQFCTRCERTLWILSKFRLRVLLKPQEEWIGQIQVCKCQAFMSFAMTALKSLCMHRGPIFHQISVCVISYQAFGLVSLFVAELSLDIHMYIHVHPTKLLVAQEAKIMVWWRILTIRQRTMFNWPLKVIIVLLSLWCFSNLQNLYRYNLRKNSVECKKTRFDCILNNMLHDTHLWCISWIA
jgi:hypothetical protein